VFGGEVVRGEMTVGELRAALAEFPDYYPVIPFVGGEEGVMLAVRPRPDRSDGSGVGVWVDEIDIPPHLQESVIEHNRLLDAHELRRTASGGYGVCACGRWSFRAVKYASEVVAAHEMHLAEVES
jgi:hypothetical protein